MDPNETLRRFREHHLAYEASRRELAALGGEANQSRIGDARDAMTDELECLATYAHNLDEWLATGGFLPDAWQR